MRYAAWRRRDTAYWTDQVVFGAALCAIGFAWAVSRHDWKLAPTAASGAFLFGWWAVNRLDRGTLARRWAWLAIQVVGIAITAAVLIRTGVSGASGYAAAVPILLVSWLAASAALNGLPGRRPGDPRDIEATVRVARRRRGVAVERDRSDARDAFGRRD